jgi:hypothetical protein
MEKELDHRQWFSLIDLEKRWSKHGISESDILHFAENGKLEICFDWVSSNIRECPNFFRYKHGLEGIVSKLIQFKKMDIDPHYIEAYKTYHTYQISSSNRQPYNRLAAIDRYCIKDFISRREIRHPHATVNGLELYYKRRYNPNKAEYLSPEVILKEHQLLVTAREVRLFEKSILGLNDPTIEQANKHNPHSKKTGRPLTATQENSHLRVMGALLEVIKRKPPKSFNLESLKLELEEIYGKEMDILGFSKSNLDTLFARANKALKDK